MAFLKELYTGILISESGKRDYRWEHSFSEGIVKNIMVGNRKPRKMPYGYNPYSEQVVVELNRSKVLVVTQVESTGGLFEKFILCEDPFVFAQTDGETWDCDIFLGLNELFGKLPKLEKDGTVTNYYRVRHENEWYYVRVLEPTVLTELWVPDNQGKAKLVREGEYILDEGYHLTLLEFEPTLL